MKLKKITALLAAVVLTLTFSLPALADDAGSGTDTVKTSSDGTAVLGDSNNPGTGGTNSAQTTITGTIKATQLKVTVPTTVAFDIDPTIEAANPSSQITAQSDKIKITNGSIVPIWVKVSNVAVAMKTAATGVTNGTAPKLVNAWPGSEAVGTDRNLMFAIKDDAKKPTGFTTAADWLVGSTAATGTGSVTGNYYVNTDGKLAAAGAASSADSVTMKIYGRTGKNWMAGEVFTITPTFTVSIKPFA